ncbi:MAG: DUF86 domain-containing protein [Nanoarchaeota archaeon]|nr:DUF86 domain-containing protein [Nanoarchaeota archaeon]
MKRIKDKAKEIKEFISELDSIMPDDLAEYKSSIEKKAACERYLEKIVEAMTDLAFLVIKARRLKIPEDDIDAFNILLENKIVDKDLTAKVKNAKGMRNILAHQYGKVDDGIVFDALKTKIMKDAESFSRQVLKVTGKRPIN